MAPRRAWLAFGPMPSRPTRRPPWIAIAAALLWTAAMIWFYVSTVQNSCGDPEQDCGLAVGLGAMMALMIWVAGAVVGALVGLGLRAIWRRVRNY